MWSIFKIQIKSKYFIDSIFILIGCLSTILQVSTQVIRTGHCHYHYDEFGRYACRLSNVLITNSDDILEVVGDHLPGHTDELVKAVFHVNSTIEFFNGEILRKFENLQFLHVNNVSLRTFSTNAFSNCHNLREFNATHNYITRFPSNLMTNCTNLTHFNIMINRFERLNGDLFGAASNLEVFYADHHWLSFIDENIFQNMRNLRIFSIDMNLISTLSPNLFRNCRNLQHFSAFRSLVTNPQIFTNLLNGLANLRFLNLGNSQLLSFDFNFFFQFQNLEFLHISAIFGLNKIAWQSLPSSLVSLIVTNIGEDLPEHAFGHLTNLTNLEFTGRGIGYLHQNAFVNLTRLESLVIRSTAIICLHPQQFVSQSNLRSLAIFDSEIENLPAGVFTPLVNLGANSPFGFAIMNSKIQVLNSNIFGIHQHLTDLNFGSNEIDKIERGTFNNRRFPRLRQLTLWDNRCVSLTFINVENLDAHEGLEWCYNHWAGLTTTTPSSVTQIWNLDISIVMSFGILMNLLRIL